MTSREACALADAIAADDGNGDQIEAGMLAWLKMEATVKFKRRWHKPRDRSPDRRKGYISDSQLRELIASQLAGRLDRSFALYIADETYYLPPIEDAKEIVKRSGLDRKKWVEERYDCDDFALVLKAHFCEAAYRDGRRRAAHCAGIVWGMFDGGPHAINFVVTDDDVLRFIEPQTGEFFLPHPGDTGIWFMLV
jgi:hypothetical protein